MPVLAYTTPNFEAFGREIAERLLWRLDRLRGTRLG